MNILNLVKTHSPLLRAVIYAGVLAYTVTTMQGMVRVWSKVQFASMAFEPGDGTALAGCSTDTECEVAEQAALVAVSKVRQAR